MKKHDRYVRILLHRKTSSVVLFPFVCYMAGVSTGYGVVRVFNAHERSRIGRTLLAMLAASRKANVEQLAQARKDRLRRSWRGEDVASEENRSPSERDELNKVFAQFPALRKGPGTYHRTFVVAELIERDDWTSRKLTHLIPSAYANSESTAEIVRIPVSLNGTGLASAVIEQIVAWKS